MNGPSRLALTYYPSEYRFYWFTARTVNLLNSADELYTRLCDGESEGHFDQSTSRHYLTIVKSGIQDGEHVYFDGFLGNANKDVGLHFLFQYL